MHSLFIAAAVVLSWGTAHEVQAVTYTFTNIVDNTTPAPSGTSFLSLRNGTISGNRVAFIGDYGVNQTAAFSGDGGALTTIIESGVQGNVQITLNGNVAISGSTVAVGVETFDFDTGEFTTHILTGSGGLLTNVVEGGDSGGTFSFIGGPYGISGDTVLFFGDSALFTITGVTTNRIVGEGDPAPPGDSFSDIFSATLSGSGVAFAGFFGDNQEGIFMGGGGALTTIAKEGDVTSFGIFGTTREPTISGNTVAFSAGSIPGPDSFVEGIFTGNGESISLVQQAGNFARGDYFSQITSPAIGGNTVAFNGRLFGQFGGTGTGRGVYTKNANGTGTFSTVIETDDELFGGIVTGVGIDGIDSEGSGNIVIGYQLADGRNGFAVAVPMSSQLLGDFNGDHIVDAADYTVWRNGLGSTYSQADYDIWKMHFGESNGPGSAGSATVPEPSGLLLTIAAIMSFRRWFRVCGQRGSAKLI
jgi:hypothetical protein